MKASGTRLSTRTPLASTLNWPLSCGRPTRRNDPSRNASGNVGKLLRGLERLNPRRRAGAFQAQAITSLLNQGQFQRLDEMDAGVAPGDFRLLQVRVGDLEGACRGVAVGHDFGDRTPLLGRGGGYGLGVEQHRLGAGRADAV